MQKPDDDYNFNINYFQCSTSSTYASENSPSSIPSPTYQWTNARFLYIKSNFEFIRLNPSAIAVELASMQQALFAAAKSPPGTTLGFWLLMPTLKPVGHHSTKLMYLLDLMIEMVSLMSLGMTSPLYNIQHAIYFPWRGSHFIMQLLGSKQLFVICFTELISW